MNTEGNSTAARNIENTTVAKSARNANVVNPIEITTSGHTVDDRNVPKKNISSTINRNSVVEKEKHDGNAYGVEIVINTIGGDVEEDGATQEDGPLMRVDRRASLSVGDYTAPTKFRRRRSSSLLPLSDEMRKTAGIPESTGLSGNRSATLLPASAEIGRNDTHSSGPSKFRNRSASLLSMSTEIPVKLKNSVVGSIFSKCVDDKDAGVLQEPTPSVYTLFPASSEELDENDYEIKAMLSSMDVRSRKKKRSHLHLAADKVIQTQMVVQTKEVISHMSMAPLALDASPTASQELMEEVNESCICVVI